jgi:hypothetical protein
LAQNFGRYRNQNHTHFTVCLILAFLFVLVFMAIVCAKIFVRLLPYLIIGAALLVVLAFISRYPWLLIFVAIVFAIIYGPRIAKAFAVPAPPPPLPGKTSTPPPLAEAAKKLSPGHISARQKFPPPLDASGLSQTGKVPVQRAKVLKAQHLRLTSGTVENDGDQSKSTITVEPKERNPIINPLFNVDDKEASEKRHGNEPGIRPTHLQGPPA